MERRMPQLESLTPVHLQYVRCIIQKALRLKIRHVQPMLTILKAHDFPPTTLQFNPRSSLLVSGSADASVRVMVVPATVSSCMLLLLRVACGY